MENIKNKDFLEALKKHFEAERDKSAATLKLYLNDPLAVADHESLIESMAKLTQQLAEAEDALDTLETHFEQKVRVHFEKKRIKDSLCWPTRTQCSQRV